MLNTLLPAALLTASVLAQSNTNTNTNTTSNSTEPQCPQNPSYNLDSPVNSSATVPIPRSNSSSPPAPWYLTVTLNDTRTPSSVDNSIWGFLSTPPNATGSTCVFLMKGELLDAQTGENGGCEGSLSQGCVDAIAGSMVLGEGDEKAGRCPSLPGLETVRGACGGALGRGWQGASTGPIPASNTTCSSPRVPGTQQPPATYSSTALFGVSGFSADESDRNDPSKFTWYDRYVSRPYPWVVAHRGENGETWTSVVCVTPGEVGDGRKEPETSGAGRRRGVWGVVVGGLGVGILMGML